jgi:hypothetical protein
MTAACIDLAGLGSIQAFPSILFTKDGKHGGQGGVYTSRLGLSVFSVFRHGRSGYAR